MTAEKEKLCPYCGGDKSKTSFKLPNKLRVCGQCYLDRNPMKHYSDATTMRKRGYSREAVEAVYGPGSYHIRMDILMKMPLMKTAYAMLLKGKKLRVGK